MKLLEFIKDYPNETNCWEHFCKERERKGIKCKKFGNTEHTI